MANTSHLFAAGLLATAVSVAAPACAARAYEYRQVGPDYSRHAYDVGYRDGLAHGDDDARHHREFRIDRDGDYRHADDGYRRDFGDREFYRREFRRGYEAGYTEGFNRIARSYGRAVVTPPAVVVPQGPAVVVPRERFVSPAAQNGYRDGLDAGRHDARDGNRFNPERDKRYREGDHDYDRRYGPRDDYKREYRDAFRQGYDEGYRAYRR
jgi:hypothetical protein